MIRETRLQVWNVCARRRPPANGAPHPYHPMQRSAKRFLFMGRTQAAHTRFHGMRFRMFSMPYQ